MSDELRRNRSSLFFETFDDIHHPGEPTHRHRLNGLEVRLLNEHLGVVTYRPSWSAFERSSDSTRFHRLYEPIGDES